MSQSYEVTENKESRNQRRRRSLGLIMAFVIGIPLGVGILALIHMGPLRDELLLRYTSHPVELVSVVLFGCAVGALLTKFFAFLREQAAFGAGMLPEWDGKPIPPEQASELLDDVSQLRRGLQSTVLGQRIMGVLEFVVSRKSANDLDDHMRGLTDSDDIALENSYSLIRFITWAIPILGFLGTVLGITGAIAGVKPEDLEKNLSQVTGGLAVAFDTTAVALALTMVIMFVNFVIERLEQSTLDRVNSYIDEHLAHRFERSGAQSSEFVDALRKNTDVLLQATNQLVQQQVGLWNHTVEEAHRQWQKTGQQQQHMLTAGLEEALQRTMDMHAQRLAAQEKQSAEAAAGVMSKLTELTQALSRSALSQQQALQELMQRVSDQTGMLSRLTENGNQLVQLQEALHHNLNVLAGAGTFEQAVSSLTAAIHLLTTRVNSSTSGSHHQRPGAAA